MITSTVAAETALQATIAADTDLTKARADYKQIFENYRVYALVAPKTSLTLSCDNLNAYATKLGAEAARLQSAIDAAKAKGGDVSVAQNAHDAALTQSSAFVAAAKTAVGSVMALTPDKGDKSLIASNKAAVNAAHAAMKAQHDAGRTAHETLKSGYAALPKRQPKTPNQAKTPKTPKTAASTTALAAVTTTAKP